MITTKEDLEKNNIELQQKIDEAEDEISDLEEQIESLRSHIDDHRDHIANLEIQIEDIGDDIENLDYSIEEYKGAIDFNNMKIKILDFNTIEEFEKYFERFEEDNDEDVELLRDFAKHVAESKGIENLFI